MEKTSFTIEIKQEVSYVFLWIVGGIIVVSVVFFSAERPTELWPAINAGGAAAAAFILALAIYTMRAPVKGKIRLIVVSAFVILALLILDSWTVMEEKSRWQRDRMMEIRELIGRGNSSAVLGNILLNSLTDYYSKSPKVKRSFGQVFKSRYPTAAEGMDIYKPQFSTDTLTHVYVHTLNDECIVLIARDKYVKGRDPAFVNYEGAVGKMQERYTLTEKGLTRESDN